MGSRRNFFTQSAAMAAGVAAIPNVHAVDSPSTNELKAVSARFSSASTWKDAKQQLISMKGGSIKWLEPFVEALDDVEIRAVQRAGDALPAGDGGPELPYECRLLEFLLSSASQLLDQCLSYRRELGALEVAAVRAAWEFRLFENLLPVEEKLQLLALQKEQASTIAKANKDASIVLDGGADALAKALAIEARGTSDAAMLTANNDTARTDLISERTRLQTAAQASYFKRHSAPGHGQNYYQRYVRVRALFLQDLQEAYTKLYCAWVGFQGVYVVNAQVLQALPALPRFTSSDGQAPKKWAAEVTKDFMPDPTQGADLLDALVVWTRRVLRLQEGYSLRETEATIVIPLTAPFLVDGAGVLSGRLMSSQVFDSALGSESGSQVVEFTLTQSYFADFTRVRLLGVGLTIGAELPVAGVNPDIARSKRYSAIVYPPAQKDALGKRYRRPPLMIGNVSVQGNGEPQIVSQSACRNLDPVGDGSWRIKLNKAVITNGQYGVTARDKIVDLKLYLRVVGEPKNLA